MYPFNLNTLAKLQNSAGIDKVVYGPDPIEDRWGWAILYYGAILYESGFVYELELQARQDCEMFTAQAQMIQVNKI
jgi:hypothetical protein